MRSPLAGFLAGVGVALVLWWASVPAMGYASAIAMPAAASPAVWQVLVVYGLGAGVAAFLVSLAMLAPPGIKPGPVLIGFSIALVAASAIRGDSARLLAAWMAGVLLAHAVLLAGRRRTGVTGR